MKIKNNPIKLIKLLWILMSWIF